MTVSSPEFDIGNDKIVNVLQIIANSLGILVWITLADDQIPRSSVTDASGHVSLDDKLLFRKVNVHSFELDIQVTPTIFVVESLCVALMDKGHYRCLLTTPHKDLHDLATSDYGSDIRYRGAYGKVIDLYGSFRDPMNIVWRVCVVQVEMVIWYAGRGRWQVVIGTFSMLCDVVAIRRRRGTGQFVRRGCPLLISPLTSNDQRASGQGLFRG